MTGRVRPALARLAATGAVSPEGAEGLAPGLDALYRAELPRLRQFFARRVGGEEAGDLVQESFARIAATFDAGDATRPSDGEKPGRPGAYLQRIAVNLLRTRARTALRRSLATHVSADEAPLAGLDPVAALEARDELARLGRALDRLGPKTRSIFLAHRVEGLRYPEIAARMNLSVKTVEWHMTKAIAHLDGALGRR